MPTLHTMKYATKRNNLFLRVAMGHFATGNCHSNYYIDVVAQKARMSEARAVAEELSSYYYADTVVDTILCLDGTEVIGACLADELSEADIINMNDGAERNDIYAGITTTVDGQAATYGIHVRDVKIKRFDLPESNLNAVYSRMISERNQMAEKYTADGNYEASIIRNNVDKQVNIIVSNAEAESAKLVAEGEAEYMRLLAEAYNTADKKEVYEFTIALDALKKSLTGEEKTIILDEDSQLAQILLGN